MASLVLPSALSPTEEPMPYTPDSPLIPSASPVDAERVAAAWVRYCVRTPNYSPTDLRLIGSSYATVCASVGLDVWLVLAQVAHESWRVYRIVTPQNAISWYNRTNMQKPPRCANSRGHDTPKGWFGMRPQYTSQTALRFWSKVDCSGEPDACWVWQTSTFASGYGQFKVGERNLRAHRVAWELTNGAIPDDFFVLHRCDNRRCVNPAHLWLGTHKENMADMQRKGRAASGDGNGSRLHPDRLVRGDAHPARRIAGWSQGERNGEAKLTAQQVRDIRAQYAAGGETLKTIGLQYGVNLQTIYKIVQRKTWRHV